MEQIELFPNSPAPRTIRDEPSGLPAIDSSHSLSQVETEQAKGRIWNGYVCPGCRNVFRVAADFAGDEVMCPSCQETLRLPKKSADIPASAAAYQMTPAAPVETVEETPNHDPVDEPMWRVLLATPAGRMKLALALGIPLLLVALVLMFLPANESPGSQASGKPVPTAPPETPAPLPPADPSQIANLVPEEIDQTPPSEPPPPALPGPAIVAEVPDEPAATDPMAQAPAPVDPEDGLVAAVPVETPVVQPPIVSPPVETPAAPGVTNDSPVTMHTVVKGDTLTKISNAHRVSVSAIRQANDMKSDTVLVGQQLRIPGGVTQVSAPPPEVPTSSPQETRHHTVVRGDTLSRIARKYSVDPKAIMQANGMKNDVIRLGAKLTIPPADR
jgi:LysM repeat protein